MPTRCPFDWKRAGIVAACVAALLAAGAPRAPAVPAAKGPSAGPAPPPSTAPAARPTREQATARLFDYLTREYVKQLKSRDWLRRSLAVVGLAQFPTGAATDAVLERLANETHPVGRLVAWQATLARADRLTDAQFAAWQRATAKMSADGLFHGDLRVGLLEVLSAIPMTADHRRLVRDLFGKANALDSSDLPTLVALGRALRAWGDAGVVEDVLASVGDANDGVRAKFVLKAAGFAPGLGEPPDKFRDWWKADRDGFTKAKPQPAARRALRPQYVDAPADAGRVDPDDKKWYRQLEMTPPGLRDFDFGIVIDCSRSMGGELARLKRDVQVMYAAFSQISTEPRVGVTAFAPGGEVRNYPLAGRKAELLAAVDKLEIFGPAGEEEWAGGLETAMTGSKWTNAGDKTHVRRVVAIISDEPITLAQHDKLVPLVRRANDEGFRVYAVMIHPLLDPPDPLTTPLDRTGTAADADGAGDGRPARRRWQSYHELTALAGGRALACRVPQGGLGLGTLTTAGRPGPRQPPPPDPATAIAPLYPGGGPTARLLTAVLVDAINPQYADRVAPVVRILVQHSQNAAPHVDERRGK